MDRKRNQITVGELVDFLSKYPRFLPVFCAASTVNEDEPEETQEFIEDDDKRICVALEAGAECATIGYIKET